MDKKELKELRDLKRQYEDAKREMEKFQAKVDEAWEKYYVRAVEVAVNLKKEGISQLKVDGLVVEVRQDIKVEVLQREVVKEFSIKHGLKFFYETLNTRGIASWLKGVSKVPRELVKAIKAEITEYVWIKEAK